MKLLLHACCGPCSLEPTRILRAAGHDLAIYYANSNIAPADEHARRLATLRAWADGEGLPVIEGPYDPAAWEACAGRVGAAALAAIGGDALRSATEPSARMARCRACYRLRLSEAARTAAELGFDGLGTTLSVSPYQFTEIIGEELERAAAGAGVAYLDGGGYEDACHAVVNALSITAGMVCDGAKPSCAGKIAFAVNAGILGYVMYRDGQQFYGGDGIVKKGVENTIDSIARLGRDGMRATNDEIIRIMLGA